MSKKKSAPTKKVAKKEPQKTAKKTEKRSPKVIVGYKTVDTDMKAFHGGKFQYTVGKDHTVKIPANDHGNSCGTGLHFAPAKQTAINFAKSYDDDYILLEVQSLESDIVGQDGSKYRTRKLFVNKVLSKVESRGPEWKKAVTEIEALAKKILIPNKNVTNKQINTAVEAIRKAHGRKKLEVYITDNIYEANAAMENIGTDFHDNSEKSYNLANKVVDDSELYQSYHFPIDIYILGDAVTNILCGYLTAHETPLGKANQKQIAKIKPFFNLLALGLLPIGFGSKQNFIIFKPNQNLKDMKTAF